jgi:hypothetical protein
VPPVAPADSANPQDPAKKGNDPDDGGAKQPGDSSVTPKEGSGAGDGAHDYATPESGGGGTRGDGSGGGTGGGGPGRRTFEGPVKPPQSPVDTPHAYGHPTRKKRRAEKTTEETEGDRKSGDDANAESNDEGQTYTYAQAKEDAKPATNQEIAQRLKRPTSTKDCTIVVINDATNAEISAAVDAAIKATGATVNPVLTQSAKNTLRAGSGGALTVAGAKAGSFTKAKSKGKDGNYTATYNISIYIAVCIIFIKRPKSGTDEEVLAACQETLDHEAGHIEIARRAAMRTNESEAAKGALAFDNKAAQDAFFDKGGKKKDQDSPFETAAREGGSESEYNLSGDNGPADQVTTISASAKESHNAEKSSKDKEYDALDYGIERNRAITGIQELVKSKRLDEARAMYDRFVADRNEKYAAAGIDVERLPWKDQIRSYARP